MLRRVFFRYVIALALSSPLAAEAAGGSVPYSPQVVKAALADGRAVLLEFAAEW